MELIAVSPDNDVEGIPEDEVGLLPDVHFEYWGDKLLEIGENWDGEVLVLLLYLISINEEVQVQDVQAFVNQNSYSLPESTQFILDDKNVGNYSENAEVNCNYFAAVLEVSLVKEEYLEVVGNESDQHARHSISDQELRFIDHIALDS